MPKPLCQYGKSCFRSDEGHLIGYVHEHIDNILQTTTTTTTVDKIEYNIPNDLLVQKGIIMEQINVIKSVAQAGTSNENENDQMEEEIIDRKPDIRDLERSLMDSKPSCSYAIKQEFGDVKIKQQPLSPGEHLQNVKMEIKSEIETEIKAEIKSEPECGMSMAQKLDFAHPYNYFLTAITSSPQTRTEPLTVTFQDILDPSLGELESSVQFNFVVEPQWLFDKYSEAGHLEKPLLIIYGSSTPMLDKVPTHMPQVTARLIKLSYGSHHTKMMFLGYADKSIRIVISTANLYEDDWRNHTQGLWMSDCLPPMPNETNSEEGDSSTDFRRDLLTYLSAYKVPELRPWIARIKSTDFSSINVFLVTSTPGIHGQINKYYRRYEEVDEDSDEDIYEETFGLGCVRRLISAHSTNITSDTPIVIQCSTMGNLETWLMGNFLNCFQGFVYDNRCGKKPEIKLIFPTVENVINSHDGLIGARCLMYGRSMHYRQKWIENHMHQWRADCRFRSRAMPLTKTYCRWSGNRLFWFLLTSANLSKSAWGYFKRRRLYINNYEVGVLFFPRFVTNTEYF